MTNSQPVSVEQLIQYGVTALTASSDSAKLDTEILLLHVLNKPRSYLFAWGDASVSEQHQEQFHALLEQRAQGIPIAHLVGEREFWSLPLSTNNSTLIPRPDTETLVEQALALSLPDNAQVLDLGTGTGAIALALASERSDWRILAVDASEDAVALAQHNQQKLNLTNVEVLQSDWFSEVDTQKFALIVSNPPYIDEADPHLHQGDVRFEPLSALTAKDSGLADIKHIISCAPSYLELGGVLMFEHGYDQGAAVRALLTQGGFENVQTAQDLGGNDRITWGFLA